MQSKFACVPYDKVGGDEQNKLRADFMIYEKALYEKNLVVLNSIPIPENDYQGMAENTKKAMLEDVVNGSEWQQKYEALTYLEILYFLVGKEIRRKAIYRLKMTDVASLKA